MPVVSEVARTRRIVWNKWASGGRCGGLGENRRAFESSTIYACGLEYIALPAYVL